MYEILDSVPEGAPGMAEKVIKIGRDHPAGWMSRFRGNLSKAFVAADAAGVLGVVRQASARVRHDASPDVLRLRVFGFQVSIIERAPTILPGFDEKVLKKVMARLSSLDIKIISGEAISKVIPKAVVLESGKIQPFDVLIWTGGVKTPAMLQKLLLICDERKRIKTSLALECLPENEKIKFAGKIFAVGDIVAGAPQVAQVALTQADIAAHNIFEDIKRENNLSQNYSPKSYKVKNYPYIIPVCGKFAVAKVGPFVISGFAAWVLKGLVELNYLFSIMPNWKALKIWLRGLIVFIKNDRLG